MSATSCASGCGRFPSHAALDPAAEEPKEIAAARKAADKLAAQQAAEAEAQAAAQAAADDQERPETPGEGT